MLRRLTKKERDFCYGFVQSGNAIKAAMDAGFGKDAVKSSDRLLSKTEVVKEIARICTVYEKYLKSFATIGYKRLAYGSVSDAVSLLFCDEVDCDKLKMMDLFCVSEIKKPKDGAMEIKFFDRIKALEKLEANATVGDNTLTAMYEAIAKGAESIGKPNED